jgi:hypothetical protein
VLLAVLLAHEEERRARGEERARGGDAQELAREAVAERSVADLVVVLRADDEAARVVAAAAEVLRDRRLYPLAVAHTASFAFSVIIGNWTVPLPRPRDIGEVKLERAFHELHREIWEALKDEVMKGYQQTGGG